jgi:biofilm PGA synthesis N-glycosyltransferase PgaC
VITDNCTDDTAGVAERAGARVFDTVDNHHKKAGALNQLLERLLPDAEPLDAFMVMDADTMLDPAFLQVAVDRLHDDPTMDAVGGVFYGESGSGLVRQLQRNEYARYSRDISRRQARVFVLTGTASVFRADTMAAIAAARGGALPGTPGQVYDTVALTEDNELTIALKSLGADLISPQECRVQTELMPTFGDLWRQRERWQRGALENIGSYGVTSATSRYWLQQSAIGYGTVALWGFLSLTVITLLCGVIAFFPFWAAVGAIFWLERVTSVWRSGWKARGLAALLFVELGYDMLLQAVYVKSLVDIATGRAREWNHVVTPQPQAREVL